MTSTARSETRSARRLFPSREDIALRIQPIESSVPFILFLIFTASFYLRFGARFPAIAPLRPDMVLAVCVLIALFPYLSQRADLFRLPATTLLNCLVLWIIVSLPFVEWPGSVLRENLFTFLKAALLFYFAIFLVDTPRRLRQFVAFFVGCQVFRVMEPLYLNLTSGYLGARTYLGPGEWAGRLSGAPADVINPNGLGFVIATAVVFTYFLLWQSPRKLLKLIYVFLLPAMLYALILTMSRGAFIALAVGAWLVLKQSKHKPMLITIGIGLCVAGWMIMSDVQRERYMSIFSSEETPQSETARLRIEGIKDEFRLGMNRPIVGHGVGTTAEAKFNITKTRARASHNLYAELLIEVGIIGKVIFLSFLWQILKVTRKNQVILAARKAGEESEYDFPTRLNKALLVIFWVYAVYSFNYFGLSQDYWYIFGGICVAFGFIMQRTEGAGVDDASAPLRSQMRAV